MEKIIDLIISKRKVLLNTFMVLVIGSAFLIPQVGINYNLSSYLPENSDTIKALDIVEEEFGINGSAQVMVKGISKEEAVVVKTELEALEGVDSVNFSPGSEDYYKDGNALFMIVIESDDYSETAEHVIMGVQSTLADYDIYMNGSAINNHILKDAIDTEIPIIALIALVFIILVLLMTATSWLEPVLFLLISGFAIVLNMGSNIILGEISFITAAIAALLQLALSMDYSIMLLHRYREEAEDKDITSTEAMKRALKNSFGPIWSSSFTTIAGVLTMVFMSFTLGRDIGFVMGKGIFISVVCVFLLMPSFILMFDSILKKTKKKALKFRGKHLASFAYAGRFIIPFVMIVLIGGSFFIQKDLPFSYSMKFDNPEEASIVTTFGENNQLIAVFPNAGVDDALKQQQFIDALSNYEIDNEKAVKSVVGYTNTAGLKMNASQAVQLMQIDPIFIEVLFGLNAFDQGDIKNTKISPYVFIEFLSTIEAENAMIGDIFGENAALLGQLYQGLKFFNDNYNAEYTPLYSLMHTEVAYTDMMESIETIAESLSGERQTIGIDASLIKAAYVLYFNEAGTVPDNELTTKALIHYANDLIENESGFASFIDADMKEMLQSSKEDLNMAEEMFNGKNYTRILITTDLPAESAEMFELVRYSRSQIRDIFGENAYVIGEVTATYDMKNSFSDELRLITIITIVTLLIIVAFAFRSASIPLILVMTIQGAFWMTMSFSTLLDRPVFFIAYIIAQSLQMGATIDYGILFTSNYVEERKIYNIKDALTKAFAMSLPTIITSSTVLVSATLIISLVSSQSLLTSICGAISIGTVVSTLFVLFGLPASLALTDRIIEKTTYRTKQFTQTCPANS